MIYHIAPIADWHAAEVDGNYTANTLATQGFIHCSDRQQVIHVANAIYSGQRDLVLLAVDPARLKAEVRYEQGDPSSPERFPHCYGPINIDAVINTTPFPPETDGSFRLPDLLRDMA